MYTASQHAIIFRPCVCSGTKRSTRESSQTYGYVCPKTKRRTKKSVRLGSGLVADTKTHCDLSSVCGRAGGQRARAPRTDTSYIKPPSLVTAQAKGQRHIVPPPHCNWRLQQSCDGFVVLPVAPAHASCPA